MRTKVLAVLSFGIMFVVGAASPSAAQQPVGIYGFDTITFPDGGIVRKVQVDSQGRLVLSGVVTDGGALNVKTTCTVLKSNTTQVNTAALAVPADGGLSGRWAQEVCNSAKNSGTPILTCTSDGQTPTTAASSSGVALEVGDCHTFLNAGGTLCIADTTATQVTSEECK